MKELQDLITKWEKEIASLREQAAKCRDFTPLQAANLAAAKAISSCLDDLKKLNMDAVKRSELIKFLTWIDKCTYFKEDNDIPIEFIIDEYQKLN